MTDTQLSILFDTWAQRQRDPDSWCAVEHEHTVEAMNLHHEGWLELRVTDDDLLWQFSDRGLKTLTAAQWTSVNDADMN